MATEQDFKRIGNYARMYNPDQNIDRRQSKRVVPREVLSLGLSKTGTLTMQKALSILGYPNPYHFSSMYDNLEDCKIWMDLLAKKFEGTGPLCKDDFDQLLGHCGAVTDMPCTLFSAELIEYYPEAKIVLVERAWDSWYKSWSAFLTNAMNPIMQRVSAFEGTYLGPIATVGNACINYMLGSPKTSTAAKARSKEMYRKHYAFVRSAAPGRILEFQAADGWEPLCEFLGKTIPNVPFPHENDTVRNTQSFEELGKIGMKNVLKRAAIAVTVVGVPTAACVYYYFT